MSYHFSNGTTHIGGKLPTEYISEGYLVYLGYFLKEHLLCFFFWPRGMWELSSSNRDQTHALCIGKEES